MCEAGPVVIFAGTQLLWGSVKVSRCGAPDTLPVVSEHRLLSAVLKAYRFFHNVQDRPIRAAFIGALSGDAPELIDLFRTLAEIQFGDAELRAVCCYKQDLSDEDARWAAEADLILVGGCAAPNFLPGCPTGPQEGLQAMRRSGVVQIMEEARSRGSIIALVVTPEDGEQCTDILESVYARAGPTNNESELCSALSDTYASHLTSIGLRQGGAVVACANASFDAVGTASVKFEPYHGTGDTKRMLRTVLFPGDVMFDEDYLENKPTEYGGKIPIPLLHGSQALADYRIGEAAKLLSGCKRVVALTGAGISAESGLPTYRDTVAASSIVDSCGRTIHAGSIDTLQPRWDQHDPAFYSDIENFKKDPVAAWKLERAMYEELCAVEPNAAHSALAMLEKSDLLSGIITQNVDGLHQRAGNARVVELHGTYDRAVCLSKHCGWHATMEDVLQLMDGLPDTASTMSCPLCGACIKPDCVYFGEEMPLDSLASAEFLAMTCDAMLVVGTSLSVDPAASLPEIARKHGAVIVEINAAHSKTPSMADVMIVARAADSLPKLAKRLLKAAST